MTSAPPVGAPLVTEMPAPAARESGLTVRVDILLWLGVIAAAAALRLARLDALPLTFDESARAFDSLRVSHNSVPEGWRGDLAAALTSYLFRIFGDSEFVTRVVPAVAGSATVAAVWFSGRALGRPGALAAAALLAFSPLALLLSRAAVPFILGGFLAVVMTASLFSYLREPRALTAFLLAVAFGLAPALFALRLNLNDTLKSGGRGATGGIASSVSARAASIEAGAGRGMARGLNSGCADRTANS